MTKYINLVLTNFNNIMILGTDKMLGIILGVLVLPVSLQDVFVCGEFIFQPVLMIYFSLYVPYFTLLCYGSYHLKI